MKNYISKIKTIYLFTVVAIMLLIATIFLYSKFEYTKQNIVKTNLGGQISYTNDITNKLEKNIIKSIKNNNLFDTLENDIKLREKIEEKLSLFITTRYRYVYIVDKVSSSDNQFRVLLDGTQNNDDKSEFLELFTPLNTKIWNKSYEYNQNEFFEHKEGMNLWMTFLNPIEINGKVVGLMVIDFALEDHKYIVKNLVDLDETFKYVVIFFIIIFFLYIWFSYFDLQREKEKENIQKQLQILNKSLESKIEDELKKSRKKDKQLLQQSRLAQMGEMISMIAHQWRQPLAAISSASLAINFKAQRENLNNEIAINLSSKIIGYSKHLSSTIDDFRNFFKTNKEKQLTSFEEIINGAFNIIEDSLLSKNIKIEKEIVDEYNFESYPNELKQVVLNLIKNAEDVLLEKDIEDPFIKIKIYKNNLECILEVSDNAGGIPLNIIDKIFDPYFSTKIKKDGTGLGLYMSKTIIEDHCSGKLEVINNKNGAIFKIVLFK